MWAAILGAAALALVGWSQFCLFTTTNNLSRTFTKALAEANRRQAEVVATLVLGYQTSPGSVPSSEASSTTRFESEISGPDVNNLDDMPDHIREAYLREATEDEEMMTLSSMRSYPLQADST